MSKRNYSMHISPNFEEAHYFCWECNHEVLEDRPYDIVKCPICDNNISVCTTYNNWNYYLQKKYVDEIEVGDLILLRSDMKSHEVLDVEEIEDDLYSVALKGYRVIKLKSDDFVECVNGTWDEDDKPWER